MSQLYPLSCPAGRMPSGGDRAFREAPWAGERWLSRPLPGPPLQPIRPSMPSQVPSQVPTPAGCSLGTVLPPAGSCAGQGASCVAGGMLQPRQGTCRGGCPWWVLSGFSTLEGGQQSCQGQGWAVVTLSSARLALQATSFSRGHGGSTCTLLPGARRCSAPSPGLGAGCSHLLTERKLTANPVPSGHARNSSQVAIF